MKNYEIYNKATKEVVQNNDVDKIACELWGLEVHPKEYAKPTIRREGEREFAFMVRGCNWYDDLMYGARRGLDLSDIKGLFFAPFIDLLASGEYTFADLILECPELQRKLDFVNKLIELGYEVRQYN